MRRIHWWRHLLVATIIIFALIYALPSAYPTVPTIDVRARTGVVVEQLNDKLTDLLTDSVVTPSRIVAEENYTSVLFNSTEDQLAAQALVQREFGTDVVVALNTKSSAPAWFADLGASAVALGLDLRGGVHFLLQVDLDFAYQRFYENAEQTIVSALSERSIRHQISSNDEGLAINFNAEINKREVADIILQLEPRLSVVETPDGLQASISPFGITQIGDQAVAQNVETLRRRVDELGVAEPVVAQQGTDRIVVQLPGLQDTARAKGILGRQAALEFRGVDERASNSPSVVQRARSSGISPVGTELMYQESTIPIFIENDVVLTGENIVDANYGSDEAGRPAVHLSLDGVGANKIKNYTRERVGEQLAIILIDREQTEVISAPRIDSELHARFLIHGGSMGVDEANELALLLRSGSLATPIEIVEERIIGPSLGADNINAGLGAVTGGFILVAILIAIYYGVFGLISVAALLSNLLCLTALLAVLGAGLTLPGLAGFALTLGMAIDANVLINERIREELNAGKTPGIAIDTGFSRAFATILDANLTTLIAGLALFALGSGPVRGFAVVLCLGLATSMFNAVVVARSFADLIYGRQRRLKQISIG